MTVCKGCKGRFQGYGRYCPRCAEIVRQNEAARHFNGKVYMTRAQADAARAKAQASDLAEYERAYQSGMAAMYGDSYHPAGQ